jgi:hypothetical protein
MPAKATKGSSSFGYWRDPVFLAACVIYAINRILIKPNLHEYSPFFHGHLDDSLLVPVALPLYLFFYRYIGLRPDNAPPRLWEIAIHLPGWTYFFEWFGPHVLHQGVADPFDAWCFLFGGIPAWLLWQRHWLAQKLRRRERKAGSRPVPPDTVARQRWPQTVRPVISVAKS